MEKLNLLINKEFSVLSDDLENETLEPIFLSTISKPLLPLPFLCAIAYCSFQHKKYFFEASSNKNPNEGYISYSSWPTKLKCEEESSLFADWVLS